MEMLFNLSRKISVVFLRISLGLILFWIGALKFADPAPVVGLLQASLPFLASAGVVYVLGAVEVAAGLLLFAGVGVRYVGLLCVGLFAGTLLIFVIAPAVTYGDAGFPKLTLPGEFLLKDLGLMAASVCLMGLETARRTRAAAR
jgi:uncharacterized membrane protein YkgB